MPGSLRLTALLACLAVAAPLAACGGGASDEEKVRKTVNDFYDGLASRDADKVCGTLSKQRRARVTGASRSGMSCESIFRLSFAATGNAFRQARQARVTGVKVNGDRATAMFELNRRSGDLKLVKEDGDWKLQDIQSARR